MSLITPEDAHARSRRGWVLVDVRSSTEYATYRVPRAVNVPLDLTFTARMQASYCLSTKIILICGSGRRSNRAATRLAAVGYTHIHVVYRGLTAWRATSGLPHIATISPQLRAKERPKTSGLFKSYRS